MNTLDITYNIAAWMLQIEQAGFDFEQKTPYHFRFFLPTCTIDIYPKSMKFHNLTTQVRGKVERPLWNFLTSHL